MIASNRSAPDFFRLDLIATIGIGCGRLGPPSYVDLTRPGTPVTRVDAALGTGEAVAFGALPASSKEASARGGKEGDDRRWVKSDGGETTTVRARVVDGKIAEPLVEQLSHGGRPGEQVEPGSYGCKSIWD